MKKIRLFKFEIIENYILFIMGFFKYAKHGTFRKIHFFIAGSFSYSANKANFPPVLSSRMSRLPAKCEGGRAEPHPF